MGLVNRCSYVSEERGIKGTHQKETGGEKAHFPKKRDVVHCRKDTSKKRPRRPSARGVPVTGG